MRAFGQRLHHHRRQARDPLHGGLLTKDRLGDAGYSAAAVSKWERDKRKISEDDWLVLVALLEVLHQYQGLGNVEAVDRLLHADNYRALEKTERTYLYPGAASPGSPS